MLNDPMSGARNTQIFPNSVGPEPRKVSPMPMAPRMRSSEPRFTPGFGAEPPKFHKGGTVPEDGTYDMKKGEVVRTPEQEKKMQEKMKTPSKAEALMTQDEPKTPKVESKPKVDAKESVEKSAGKSNKGKVKHKHTHIEHHDDGSHTVRHTPAGGGDEVSYASPNLQGVHAGLDQHVGGAQAAAPMAAEPPAPPAAAGAVPPAAGAPPTAPPQV
jgi:hypothetical protein